MTPRGALVLCCALFSQLKIHLAVFTLLFPLQVCYKPLGIPQKVTLSQKVHISSHDGLQNFMTPTFLNISPIVSKSECRVAGISSFPQYTKFVN